LIQECACVGLCVTFVGSKKRYSSTKSNCHRRMNRCLVGSGVGSSGEGVCAFSSSLLEIFLPSDEPTLPRFNPAVHPALKEISLFHRPSLNCSDATKYQDIGSSDAQFHSGAEQFQWFGRRSLFAAVDSSGAILTCWSHLSYLFGVASPHLNPNRSTPHLPPVRRHRRHLRPSLAHVRSPRPPSTSALTADHPRS
jgi:hypothetical protein